MPSPTDGWTRASYDLAGRGTEAASFAGDAHPLPPETGTAGTGSSGSVVTTYNRKQTTVGDQAGKQRRSTIDGLGRLTKVEELMEHPSSTLYSTTSYIYDARGNLLKVDQPSQTRRLFYLL